MLRGLGFAHQQIEQSKSRGSRCSAITPRTLGTAMSTSMSQIATAMQDFEQSKSSGRLMASCARPCGLYAANIREGAALGQ